MCGICGIYHKVDSDKITYGLLDSMMNTMAHRGPDGFGGYITNNGQVALGHRRLSIIDLSSDANQPMSNEDDTIHLVYNGEIYNYLELRKWLIIRGHQFQSNSDSEVILHLYEECGVDCVDKLDGMFAFAIYDTKTNIMMLARDRVGKKPLYYTVVKDKFIFASEIKAILKHPDVIKKLDLQAMYDYLTLYVSVSPNTMFSGIYKLDPGYRIICSREYGVNIEQYWDLFNNENILRDHDLKNGEVYSDEVYSNSVQSLLRCAIEKRMMSDVPYGVFLSGGLDSSLNVGLMSQLTDKPINTFTIGYKDQPKYDEFQYARQIAKQFKTNHYETFINAKDVLDFIPKMVYYQDEPVADWVGVPLYYLGKLAYENGVKTIQLGEGSDELFFGYDGYVSYLKVYNYFWKYYMKLPQAMRTVAHRMLSPLSPFAGKGPGVSEIFRCAANNEELFWGGALTFTESQKYNFVASNGLNTFDSLLPYFHEFNLSKHKDDFIQKMLYIEFKHRLPELLLMRVDKMLMASSVEGRAPYLDIDLIKYVTNIPTNLKYKNGEKKYILKKAAEGVIPNEIIYRKKQGFSTPVKEWFDGELGVYMADTIMFSQLKRLEIFDYKFIGKMIINQRHGKSDNSARLWSLYNLSEWYKYWFN